METGLNMATENKQLKKQIDELKEAKYQAFETVRGNHICLNTHNYEEWSFKHGDVVRLYDGRTMTIIGTEDGKEDFIFTKTHGSDKVDSWPMKLFEACSLVVTELDESKFKKYITNSGERIIINVSKEVETKTGIPSGAKIHVKMMCLQPAIFLGTTEEFEKFGGYQGTQYWTWLEGKVGATFSTNLSDLVYDKPPEVKEAEKEPEKEPAEKSLAQQMREKGMEKLFQTIMEQIDQDCEFGQIYYCVDRYHILMRSAVNERLESIGFEVRHSTHPVYNCAALYITWV